MSQNEQQLGSSAQFAFISSLSVIMPRFLSFFLKAPGSFLESINYKLVLIEYTDDSGKAEAELYFCLKLRCFRQFVLYLNSSKSLVLYCMFVSHLNRS